MREKKSGFPILKISFLILALFMGWAFVNIAALFKFKKSHDASSSDSNLWGIDGARADVPPPPPPPPPSY